MHGRTRLDSVDRERLIRWPLVAFRSYYFLGGLFPRPGPDGLPVLLGRFGVGELPPCLAPVLPPLPAAPLPLPELPLLPVLLLMWSPHFPCTRDPQLTNVDGPGNSCSVCLTWYSAASTESKHGDRRALCAASVLVSCNAVLGTSSCIRVATIPRSSGFLVLVAMPCRCPDSIQNGIESGASSTSSQKMSSSSSVGSRNSSYEYRWSDRAGSTLDRTVSHASRASFRAV